MGKFKIKHISWFFSFIGSCIRDLTSPKETIKYGLIRENWQDFKTRLIFDTDPEMIEITKELEQYIKNEKEN